MAKKKFYTNNIQQNNQSAQQAVSTKLADTTATTETEKSSRNDEKRSEITKEKNQDQYDKISTCSHADQQQSRQVVPPQNLQQQSNQHFQIQQTPMQLSHQLPPQFITRPYIQRPQNLQQLQLQRPNQHFEIQQPPMQFSHQLPPQFINRPYVQQPQQFPQQISTQVGQPLFFQQAMVYPMQQHSFLSIEQQLYFQRLPSFPRQHAPQLQQKIFIPFRPSKQM
ncbi:hypothetical protein FQR65_LT03690 [Abscondita terminalis]|nr:hypothetical protein FQR65_LT03690 [Abscondita terminalis]